jgi:hypothetical protein
LPDGSFGKTKIQIWVKFGGTWNGKCWHNLLTFVILNGPLVYLVVIWYIFRSIGMFKKILATLLWGQNQGDQMFL